MLNQAADPFGIIGQVLDSQFRVDRLVGEGGFSAVYRGHHLGLDEPIAIKCLKLPPSLSPLLVEQFERRFRDESRILYRLSQGNLNIVRSIAAGTWQSPVGILVPYMVLEWMEGRSLANEFTIRRTVGKQGRPLEEVLQVFESAADGISYAHAQGVIHRDLNPGNFFFTSSPQGQRLKVLDFGVAKILDDSTLNIERSQTVGQIRIFAPAYGSPEQFDDALGRAAAPSDVYAFALILLEALRDRPVNDGTHLGEFAQRALDPRTRPTPRTLGIDVPDEVESIFARATRLNPSERWQSVSEFWQALSHATSAASQQKHAQAAAETPSLGMPQPPSRSTKTGMAPPAQVGKPAMKRMDKTMPVGAVLPPLPGQPARPPAPPSAPRVPNAPAPPPPVVSGAADDEGDEATRIGQSPPQIVQMLGEDTSDGDEPTRVGAPTADVLQSLAEEESRQAAAPVTMNRVSNNQPPPRPAAGQPLPGSQPHMPAQPPAPRAPNPHAGTLMMNPNAANAAGFGPIPPVPTAGRPMGPPPGQPQMPTTPGLGPQPAPYGQSQGGPPPQIINQPPPQQQQPPMQQQGYGQQMPPQQPMQQQMPPQQQPMQPPQQQQQQMYGAQPVDPSVSPAGVPKKSNVLLWVMIGLGIPLLLGVAAAVVIVASGAPKTPTVSSASVSAVTPPVPVPTQATTASAEPTGEPTGANTVATPPPEPEDAGAAAAPTDTAPVAQNNNPTNNNTAPAPGPSPMPQPNYNWQPPGPSPTPAKSAEPVDPNAFNEGAARSALAGANGVVAFCKKADGPTGPGTATVTFNPDGSVGSVAMDPPYAGTPTGDCIKGQLQRAKTKSFQGSPQSVKDSFTIPK